jgi:hypothetical protein
MLRNDTLIASEMFSCFGKVGDAILFFSLDLLCSGFLLLEHAAEYADFRGETEEEGDEIDHFG